MPVFHDDEHAVRVLWRALIQKRMHSSRMRTGRSLTVCWGGGLPQCMLGYHPPPVTRPRPLWHNPPPAHPPMWTERQVQKYYLGHNVAAGKNPHNLMGCPANWIRLNVGHLRLLRARSYNEQISFSWKSTLLSGTVDLFNITRKRHHENALNPFSSEIQLER